MPTPRPSLPAWLVDGPFTFGEASDAGVPRRRLQGADVAHPHHGVYDPDPAAADLRRRCERLLPVLGPHRWFSHLTAARLWGMPLPFSGRDDESLHVVARSGTVRIRRPGVVGWRSDSVLATSMLGILPVVHPADVWCQLAVPGATGRHDSGVRRALSEGGLVAIADFLLTGPFAADGLRRPLVTRDELHLAVRRRGAARGVVALRTALDRARASVHSPRETELRLLLVDHGLPEPKIQVPVLTSAGWRRADLGYPAASLLLEYFGDHHRTDRRQWRTDLQRSELFREAGYRVMIFSAADLEDPGVVAARVRTALRASSAR